MYFGGSLTRHLVGFRMLCPSRACSVSYSDRLPKATVELAEKRGKAPTSGLAFGRHFSDHMFVAEFDTAHGGWHKARIEPLRALHLHPASKALHTSISVFEGMKAFRGVDGRIRLFRPHVNAKRLNDSADRAVLPRVNADDMVEACKQLIRIDREYVPHAAGSEPTSLYIRPTIVATESVLDFNDSKKAFFFVLLSPVGAYFPTGLKPISLLATTQYVRAALGGTGANKMSGNYAPTIYVQKLAERSNCQQVLWLHKEVDQSGTLQLHVTEVGTMNCFVFLKNKQNENELVTAPLNGLILPGVTRKSVLELARKWGEFRVSERTITMQEVLEAIREDRMLEMFGTGTACVVCPIHKILFDKEELQVRCPMDDNSLTKRVFDTITKIQYGRMQFEDWCDLLD